MTEQKVDIETIAGKAQISCTIPIPLYIWVHEYVKGGDTTISGFVSQLIADARAREQEAAR
jgi:hypothetical protein